MQEPEPGHTFYEKEQTMGISEIKVVTTMSKITPLKHALTMLGVSGITVMQVIGCGVEKGTYEYEGEENVDMELLPKQLIYIVVEDSILDKVVDTIKKELYTGHIGDGKIFISPLSNVIRVRTGEEGADALH